jgi:hypothetical protein
VRSNASTRKSSIMIAVFKWRGHGLDENHLRIWVMVWMRIICGVRQLARTLKTEIDGEEEADKPQGFPNTANSTSCTAFLSFSVLQ